MANVPDSKSNIFAVGTDKTIKEIKCIKELRDNKEVKETNDIMTYEAGLNIS